MNEETMICPECSWNTDQGEPIRDPYGHGICTCPACEKNGRLIELEFYKPPDTAPASLSGNGPELLQCSECGVNSPRVKWGVQLAWSKSGRVCPLCGAVKTFQEKITPEPLSGNDRLCAAIAEVLMREDLTPEARALVQLALRTQRGEVVDLRAEMERRG